MSTTSIATARAFSNIAFIKYWGNRDHDLRLPANGSISMNLAGLETVTTVRFSSDRYSDTLFLNGRHAGTEATRRVSRHLDHIRKLADSSSRAIVISQNNFPMGAGIASSAAAFAALTLAACSAQKMDVDERTLSALARLGSGSASRSIPAGFVEWYAGDDHDSSYAESIASAQHWNLVDLIAVVSDKHKAVGSTGGHALADSSPLQTARIADTPRRLDICREALLNRDFEALAEVVELDALMMHGVMMTSSPPVLYWKPPTLRVMEEVQTWRREGFAACFTMDAGANVHVITLSEEADLLETRLRELEGVQDVLIAPPGGPASVLEDHLKLPDDTRAN